MSGIQGRNTRPEILIRKALFARGFRYRLHDKRLPGKPDLVFPRYRAVIQIHGCFWHGHDCHLFKWPSTRPEFWRQKIHSNVERDTRNQQKLLDAGWRTLVIWECTLKGRLRRDFQELVSDAATWLVNGANQAEISSKEKESVCER